MTGEVESRLDGAGALEIGGVGVVTCLVASIMLDPSDEDRTIEARLDQLPDASDIEYALDRTHSLMDARYVWLANADRVEAVGTEGLCRLCEPVL